MGGSLGVESEGVGLGSTFWFEVPLRVLSRPSDSPSTVTMVSLINSDEDATAEPQRMAAAMRGLSRSIHDSHVSEDAGVRSARAQPTIVAAAVHILIVDDQQSIRMLMTRLVQKHVPSSVITTAADGEDAFRSMVAAKGEESLLFTRGIVLMDKEMPRCDGFVATQRIRGLGFQGLILGVTGNAIAEDISEFIDLGANAVITKPVSVTVLVKHIRDFVFKAGSIDSLSNSQPNFVDPSGNLPASGNVLDGHVKVFTTESAAVNDSNRSYVAV